MPNVTLVVLTDVMAMGVLAALALAVHTPVLSGPPKVTVQETAVAIPVMKKALSVLLLPRVPLPQEDTTGGTLLVNRRSPKLCVT
jgi:hypothetical protein